MKPLKIDMRCTALNGFTLVELLVTMAILSILFAIAGLSMRSWLGKASAEEQIKQMYADCVNARSRAMNRNRSHFVEIVLPNQYRIWEDTNPAATDGNNALENIVPGTIPGAAGGDTLLLRKITTWNLTSGGIVQFTFDPRGGISWLPGNIPNARVQIQSIFNPAVDCISLSATRIRLGRWDGAANCVSQ